MGVCNGGAYAEDIVGGVKDAGDVCLWDERWSRRGDIHADVFDGWEEGRECLEVPCKACLPRRNVDLPERLIHLQKFRQPS